MTDMTKINQVKPIFDKEFNTNFKVINDVVLLSSERQVYIRLCKSTEDIAAKKATLADLVASRNEPAITFIDEGHKEKFDAHFLVYT